MTVWLGLHPLAPLSLNFFCKIGFCKSVYLIHKMWFFIFKDHPYQMPANSFVKSQTVGDADPPVCSNYSICHCSAQAATGNVSEWRWLSSKITSFMDTMIWISCNFHIIFCFWFFLAIYKCKNHSQVTGYTTGSELALAYKW